MALTNPWEGRSAGQIDADSPIDETLITGISNDLYFIRQVLYGTGSGTFFTAAEGHDHDGVNSKARTITQSEIGAAAVGHAQLKTSSGEVNTSAITANLVLPGGSYGFYPQVRTNTATTKGWLATLMSPIDAAGTPITFTSSATFITAIQLGMSSGGHILYAQQRYVTASPPFKLGTIVWKHFLFLLRTIATGEVISAYEADTPPWHYNGKIWLPKDHSDRIEAVPHPFIDYWDKDPAVDGLEIVLVDLNEVDVDGWIDNNRNQGISLLDDIQAVLPGKGKSHHAQDFGADNINRFSERVKIVTP